MAAIKDPGACGVAEVLGPRGACGRDSDLQGVAGEKEAGGYLRLLGLAEGIALYGLVIMFLILTKLGRVTAADAASLAGPATVFGALMLLSGVLVGYLPSRVSVSANGYEGWTTKLVAAFIGLSVALIGLVYAFLGLGKI